VRLHFKVLAGLRKLLEANWQFANFSLEVRLTDPMLIVDSQITERHGSVRNICLFLDIDRKDR